jgi:transcriptional regulator with XRE-family HTH domain
MAVRARRHRRGWRLADLAAAAGVGAGVCGLLERGEVGRLTVRTARAIAAAVDLPLSWDIGWQRMEVERLLDADHATLCAGVAELLVGEGWEIRSEVSFNHYGDRGRIDLLAWHAQERVALVIEAKTAIVGVEQTLGLLDVKARVAKHVVAEIGWPVPGRVVPALFIADGTTARRHVKRVAVLFRRYDCTGAAARAWLRRPSERIGGLLRFVPLPIGNGVDRRRADRRRVRRSLAESRSAQRALPSDQRRALG